MFVCLDVWLYDCLFDMFVSMCECLDDFFCMFGCLDVFKVWMFVFLYACIFVCLFVWMFGCLELCMFGGLYVFMILSLYQCMYVYLIVCIYVYLYVSMNVSVFVCMCVCFSSKLVLGNCTSNSNNSLEVN